MFKESSFIISDLQASKLLGVGQFYVTFEAAPEGSIEVTEYSCTGQAESWVL